MTAAAAAPLDVARVRAKLREVRRLLVDARAILEELYAARAWVALGLPSWEELCRQELPELGELLTVAERRELVVELRRGGLSLRAAAAPAGVSAATAKSWADDAGVQLATVTSLDGRARPATSTSTPAPRRRRSPLTDRVVQLVAGAGDAGLTVRDVAREVRQPQHIAAATLTRLTQAGRVRYERPERRGLFGRYVAGTVTR